MVAGISSFMPQSSMNQQPPGVASMPGNMTNQLSNPPNAQKFGSLTNQPGQFQNNPYAAMIAQRLQTLQQQYGQIPGAGGQGGPPGGGMPPPGGMPPGGGMPPQGGMPPMGGPPGMGSMPPQGAPGMPPMPGAMAPPGQMPPQGGPGMTPPAGIASYAPQPAMGSAMAGARGMPAGLAQFAR